MTAVALVAAGTLVLLGLACFVRGSRTRTTLVVAFAFILGVGIVGTAGTTECDRADCGPAHPAFVSGWYVGGGGLIAAGLLGLGLGVARLSRRTRGQAS